MKKRGFLILFICAALVLGSCKGAGGKAESPVSPVLTEDNPWAEVTDLSSHAEVSVVVFGNRPNDFDEVLQKINERMTALINTEISVRFVTLSEWPVVYPLLLSGGENIDLIYTASWCHYSQEALRGAYTELSSDFVSKYMPVSYRDTPERVWKQAAVGGKVYALPRTYTDCSSYASVLIRKDILDKTGIKEVKSFDDYEKFLLACTKLSGDGYGLNAFPSLPMVRELMLPREHMLTLTEELVWDTDDGAASADKIQFLYDTDEYLTFCLRMARWAEEGVWPKNAISGTIHTNIQFEEGRSYSIMVRMHEAQVYLDAIEAKGYSGCLSCILDPEAYVKQNDYSGDMMAISSFSRDPGRAALCLDVLKNDREINLLCQGGIEGKHYILNADGTRSQGSKHTDYIWSDWVWALRNEKIYPEERRTEEVQRVSEEVNKHMIPEEMWPFDGLRLSDAGCEAELSVIRSLIQEYEYSFNLGVYGDETEKKVQEFRASLQEAGLPKVMESWRTQIEEFLSQK